MGTGTNEVDEFETQGGSTRAFWCRALGEFALYRSEASDQPLMGAGKSLALLVYLGLSPQQRANRNHLTELLWPGTPNSEARHSLRQAVYRLRVATGGTELIQASTTDLELLPVVRFDFLEGELALTDGELLRACEFLRGNLLEGYSIPESREFETWCESQRTRFSEMWARVARELTEDRLESGDADGAVEIAEQLGSLRPFDDDPALLLMRALAAAGRNAAAVSRFHAYADLLRSEIETEPGETIARYAEELESILVARTASAPGDLPFVGRIEEWAVLEAAWEDAGRGTCSTVLLEGSAGLGKTRIISELASRVEVAKGLILQAKCYEIERTVPYSAIAEALSTSLDRPELERLSTSWLAEAARLLPELRERFPELPMPTEGVSSPAAKRRLHQAIARWLEVLSLETPVLLAIDDVHWADVSTLEVLHFLAHKLQDTKIVLVTSYRPAELTPAARRFTRSLLSSKLGKLVVLEPLTSADVAQLLGSLGEFGATSVGRVVSELLYSHSGGNPLFLSELLEALSRDRVLRVSNGQWKLDSRVRIEELPKTLGKLLSDRIDALDPWMRACVDTMAVAAGGTSVEVLARVLQISEPRAEVALAVLTEERIVRSLGAGQFELIHDELRHLVYLGIPDERRRVLHLEVGAALQALGEERRPGGAARLAFHFDQAGEAERAHRYALVAAGEAETLSALDAQREHLELATAHSPRALPPGPSEGYDAARRSTLLDGRWPIPAGLFKAPIAVAAGAFILIGIGLIAGLVIPSFTTPGPPTDFRQGTVYLALPRTFPATHRIEWSADRGELAEIVELGEYPDELPPVVWYRNVERDGEFHTKLFRQVDRDTVQLTFGSTDDLGYSWSPDRRFLAGLRGFRASENRYITRVVLLDAMGQAHQLTDTEYQDGGVIWHPSGTQLAFVRDSAGLKTLWMIDADGGHPRNVSEEFVLPLTTSRAGFSPMGDQLAVVYSDTGSNRGALFVLDLVGRTARPLRWTHSPAPAQGGVHWSPDGQWLLYGTATGARHRLWAISVDGTAGPFMVAEPPDSLALMSWTGGPERYAARVDIEPAVLELRKGSGLRAKGMIQTRSGDPLNTPIRWSVGNEAIAGVDDLGFVRGRSAGTTYLIASAGGVIADTVPVNVRFSGIDTLFVEEWADGIGADVWMPFGNPQPIVVGAGLADGRAAFLNNGDFNQLSGAVSTVRFDATDSGVTVEVEAWLPFTGDYWQDWHLTLLSDSVTLSGSELSLRHSPASVSFSGSTPIQTSAEWSACRQGGDWEPASGNPELHHIAIQVRPDSVAECYVDGVLLARQTIEASLWGKPFALALMGRTYGTNIYHGRVLVTRGLRY